MRRAVVVLRACLRDDATCRTSGEADEGEAVVGRVCKERRRPGDYPAAEVSAREQGCCCGGVAMGKRDGYGSQQGGWKKEGFNGSGTAPSPHAAWRRICSSSPPTTMRSTANCFARRAAPGGRQAVAGGLQAARCAIQSRRIVHCDDGAAVQVFALGNRGPVTGLLRRPLRLVTAHHLFAVTVTLSP
jgi:hypothetical protein